MISYLWLPISDS